MRRQIPVTVGEVADGATPGVLVAGLVMMSPIDVRIGDDSRSPVFQSAREIRWVQEICAI